MASFSAPPFADEVMAKLLALNNAHAAELSLHDAQTFARLLAAASHVRAEEGGQALIVAFDESCAYDNPNFAWVSERFAKFHYIDRVVVAAAARGRGLARAMYAELEDRARREGRERLVCEINSLPPNPESDAFHVALGFTPAGAQALAGTAKTVRYWSLELIPASSPA